MLGRKSVLQLNADYKLISIISLQRAICLYMSNKVAILEEDQTRPILHKKLGIKPPIIVALKRYISIPYRTARVTRKNVLLRDENKCQYCGVHLGKHNATVDHVVPRSHKHFPGNIWTNVVACCMKCNLKKDNKLLVNTDMQLIRRPFKPQLDDLLVTNYELKRILNKYTGGN